MSGTILDIYTDGGSRGNPGPSGIGVVIKENKENIGTFAKYIGEGTNNQAEYEAVILGLEEAKKLKADELNFFIDSELVVNQLNRKYKVKDQKLGSLFVKAWNLMTNFKLVTYTHIPREKNTEADALVNQALDAQK
ncbi:MAG: ribonuclease HI family protein [Candidatus Kerfeldbacteria bacterium]|jgi:ribonuclease HI